MGIILKSDGVEKNIAKKAIFSTRFIQMKGEISALIYFDATNVISTLLFYDAIRTCFLYIFPFVGFLCKFR